MIQIKLPSVVAAKPLVTAATSLAGVLIGLFSVPPKQIVESRRNAGFE